MSLLVLLKGHYEINKTAVIANAAFMSCCWLVKLCFERFRVGTVSLNTLTVHSRARLILVTFEYSESFVDAAGSSCFWSRFDPSCSFAQVMAW